MTKGAAWCIRDERKGNPVAEDTSPVADER